MAAAQDIDTLPEAATIAPDLGRKAYLVDQSLYGSEDRSHAICDGLMTCYDLPLLVYDSPRLISIEHLLIAAKN